MHGGSAGSGAPMGNRNALRNGMRGREAVEGRRMMASLMRALREGL
jgi:hypothetical protein